MKKLFQLNIIILIGTYVNLFHIIDHSFAQTANNENDRVWNVEISGNTTYEDIVIQRYIANERPRLIPRLFRAKRAGLEFSEDDVRKDAIRIQRFYSRRGFVNAEVSYIIEEGSRSWQKKIHFQIKENEPIRIGEVTYSFQADANSRRIIQESPRFQQVQSRLPYRTGRRFQQIEQSEVVGSLTREIRNLGFPYVIVEVQEFPTNDSKTVNLEIEIQTGPRARIDNIFVEGATTIDPYLIRRETGIEPGEFYNENDISDAQREVYKHQLFRLALISIPEQPQDSTVDIEVLVKELPLRSFRVRGGIGDFDRDPLWWQVFRFQSSWIYRNVGGRGEQFSINGKLSFFDKYVSMNYLFPYVYNTKSSFVVNPYIENKIEEAYSITSGGIINSLGYEYGRNLTGTFSYEFALNNEYDIKVPDRDSLIQVLPDSILAYNVSSFSFNAYYAHGLQSGKKGWIIQPYWELSGLFGESSFSFQKLSLEVRKYTEINPTLVVAARAQGGTIYYSKQDSLPSDIVYYAGGTSSIRGYERQDVGPKRPELILDPSGNLETVRFIPLGGRSVLNFNIEMRQDLDRFIKGFGIAAFLDGGQVWTGAPNLSKRNIQYGTGGGLRYDSPIGPIRIDVGYKVNPEDADLGIYEGVSYGGSRWRIHFSIGQAF